MINRIPKGIIVCEGTPLDLGMGAVLFLDVALVVAEDDGEPGFNEAQDSTSVKL